MIFSALTLTIFISNILGNHEKFCLPFTQCLGQLAEEPNLKTDIQSRIEENTEKIVELLTHNFNLQAPLPFTFCTNPAPFDIAKSNKNRMIFECILKRPDFNIYEFIHPKDNSNLFHVTAEYGSTHLMSALFKHCQEKNIDYLPLINMTNTKGKTPLGLTAACCRTICLKMLLEHGARHDNKNMPLLHIAASTNTRGERKRNKTVRALCESEWPLWEKDHQGRTALDLAKVCTYQSTVECIKGYEKIMIDNIEEIQVKRRLYFNRLPKPVWQLTMNYLRGPEVAIGENDQSQAA
jgi:hypothetical protein